MHFYCPRRRLNFLPYDSGKLYLIVCKHDSRFYKGLGCNTAGHKIHTLHLEFTIFVYRTAL